MNETDQQQSDSQADSGAQHGQPTMRLRVSAVPACKPEAQGDQGSFDATESELLHVLQSLILLTGENLDQWTWEERRDFLNWCLDEGVLTIQDGRLVPVEEDMILTSPLKHDTDTYPPNSAEELADSLRLNSAVSAQSLKVSVNAHKSAQEGADECSHVFQRDGAGTIG
jgi:hypothetical protein